MKKTTFRRMTALVIALTFLVAFIPSFTANAAANHKATAHIICNDSLYETHKELCDVIAEGIDNLEDEIFVGDLTVNPADLPFIIKTVTRIHPELFFVNTNQFAVESNGNEIDFIIPFYNNTKEEIINQRARFEARVDEILALIHDDMSDLEKALILHDEIILNCTYIEDDEMEIINTSAYDALVEGKATSQGITEAYSYLLLLADITTQIVESREMTHLWNSVCIDGEFYNVDVTYDTPEDNEEGHVNHKYFLLSDTAIINYGSYGFTEDSYTCDNTKFDNAEFHNNDTRFHNIEEDNYDEFSTEDTAEEFQLRFTTKTADAPTASILIGDIDFDGTVKITDATLVQKFTAQMESFDEAQFTAADINGDGIVNIIDSTEIQKMIAGLA